MTADNMIVGPSISQTPPAPSTPPEPAPVEPVIDAPAAQAPEVPPLLVSPSLRAVFDPIPDVLPVSPTAPSRTMVAPSDGGMPVLSDEVRMTPIEWALARRVALESNYNCHLTFVTLAPMAPAGTVAVWSMGDPL